MNETTNYGFGIKVIPLFPGTWSFGSSISHSFGETYLFINFAKWSVCIGWIMKDEEAENGLDS
jgi:hypothetical protein